MVKKKSKQAKVNVVDITDMFKGHCGIEKMYTFPSEQQLAKYAVTKFVKKYATSARHSTDFTIRPTTTTIKTDINQSTIVFENVTAALSLKLKGRKAILGMVQAVQYEYHYSIRFSAETNEDLALLENEYAQILEHNNFFQGKFNFYP